MEADERSPNRPGVPRMGLNSGRIALIYAVVAGLWVLLSDTVLAWLVHDPLLVARIGVAKGAGFVAVTAILLYLVVRSHVQGILASDWALQRANGRLWILTDIASLLVRAESDRDLLPAVCAVIAGSGWVRGAAYCDVTGDGCRLAAAEGGWRPDDCSLAERVLASRTVEMLVPDRQAGAVLVAAAPVATQSGALGALIVAFAPGYPADAETERVMRRAADTLAVGLASMRAREQTEWEAAREAACSRMSECLASPRPVGLVAERAAEAAAALSGCPHAVVCAREERAGRVGMWLAGPGAGEVHCGLDGGDVVFSALAATVTDQVPRVLTADDVPGCLCELLGPADRVDVVPVAVEGLAVGVVALIGGSPQPRALAATVRIAALVAEAVQLQQWRDELRSVNEHLDAIVKASPLAVISTNSAGLVTTWNPAAERVLGWRRVDVIGRKHPAATADCAAELDAVYRRAMGGGTVHGHELHWVQQDGSRVELALHLAPLHGPGGEVAGILAIADDITESKWAEEALRRTMKTVADLFGAVPTGLAIFQFEEPDRLVLVDANPAAEKIVGLALADWRGKRLDDFWNDVHAGAVVEQILTAVWTKSAISMEDVSFTRDGAGRCLRMWAFAMSADRVGLAFEDITDAVRTQSELHDATSRLTTIFEGASVGIVITRDRAILSANPRFYRLFGLPEDVDLAGIDPLSLAAEDRREDLLAYSDRGRLAGVPAAPLETVGRRFDGTEFAMLLDPSIIRLPDGNAFVVFVTDMSVLRKTQEDLRITEDRLRQTLDTIPLCAVSIDADGLVTYINDYALQMMGYSRDEVIGHNWFHDFVVEEETSVGLEDFSRQQADGLLTRNYERLVRTRSGERRAIGFSTTLLRDARGVIVGASGIGEDITERRKAEQALRQSEQRLRKVLHGMPVLLCAFDERGVLVEWNGEAERVTGYSAAEIVGNPRGLQMLYPDAETRTALISEWVATAYDERESVKTVACRDGSRRLIAWSSIASRAPIPGWAHWAVGTDVTERVRAESEVKRLNQELEQRVEARTQELQAAYKEMEAFSYSVSHDLRAPLRGIDGFGQALVEDCFDQLGARGQGYVGRIRAATQRMGQLIDDLLVLSRVSRAEIHREDVDLSAMCARALEELRQSEPDRRVDARVVPGIHVLADRRLLAVAMENLLGNAWKFTSRTPDARIEVSEVAARGVRCIRVSDNGAGFDMQYAGKLFGPFQRLHAADEFPGTGIGLATVQRVVSKHGWTVWAEAEVGNGATFYVGLREEPSSR